MTYTRFDTRNNVDLANYIHEYKKIHPETQILIGADSQNVSKKTVYVVVVALYIEGKGAHILFNKWNVKKVNNMAERLLHEVWSAVKTAEYIKEQLGYDQVGIVDIDLNPDPKYKSNTVFRQAVGLVEGMGYKVRTKHTGALITYAADYLAKH